MAPLLVKKKIQSSSFRSIRRGAAQVVLPSWRNEWKRRTKRVNLFYSLAKCKRHLKEHICEHLVINGAMKQRQPSKLRRDQVKKKEIKREGQKERERKTEKRERETEGHREGRKTRHIWKMAEEEQMDLAIIQDRRMGKLRWRRLHGSQGLRGNMVTWNFILSWNK